MAVAAPPCLVCAMLRARPDTDTSRAMIATNYGRDIAPTDRKRCPRCLAELEPAS